MCGPRIHGRIRQRRPSSSGSAGPFRPMWGPCESLNAVGIGRALALWQAAGARFADYAPGHGAPAAPLSIWQEHTLSPILWNDLWGVDAAPVTVMDALTVPAVAKGRAILHALIKGRPLRALRGPDLVDPQPAWLYRSDRGLAPQYRLGLILDDLIFRDASLLLVDR